MSIKKIIALLKKETLILLSDKPGLVLLFMMPLLLVFIITIIQDSALKIANENKISMLVVNQDSEGAGIELIDKLKTAGMFDITISKDTAAANLTGALLSKGYLIGLYIPKHYTSQLRSGAAAISAHLMSDLGLEGSNTDGSVGDDNILTVVYDPVLQANFTHSIRSVLEVFVTQQETGYVIDRLYEDTGIEQSADAIKKQMLAPRESIQMQVATRGSKTLQPSSTQHNVPAWTIFAMFFMVVSLGGSIVKERLSGSFLRLRTMPTSFKWVLWSKMMVYVLVGILQVVVIFAIGIFVFKPFGMEPLQLPNNVLGLVLITVLSAMSAVSYAIMVGVWSKSLEQTNGFGAVSIVLLAALGGIWVPIFIMPEFLQLLSKLSPMQWCLQGYYVLFLKGGAWADLKNIVLYLVAFISLMQLGIYTKLRTDKLI